MLCSQCFQASHDFVNPGLINPWLINRGVSPVSGTFGGNTPLLMGRVYESWVHISRLAPKKRKPRANPVSMLTCYPWQLESWVIYVPGLRPSTYFKNKKGNHVKISGGSTGSRGQHAPTVQGSPESSWCANQQIVVGGEGCW